MKRTLFIIIATALLASCGIYKKYERPESVVCDSIFGAEHQTSDTASIASLGWKELFTDPHLQTLIDSALVRNTDLRSAQLRVEQALVGLRIARLDYLPSINLVPEGAVGGFNNYDMVKSGPDWTYNIAAAASWEVETFGKKTNAKRKAQSAALMAKDYELATKTGLIAGVATQYYTLLMLDEQLRIAQSTCDKFRQSVRVMKAMKDAGMATEVAVAQLEGAWYQVEAAVKDIRKSINDIELSLCATLCEQPHHIVRGKLADANFPSQLKTGVPLSLLSRRPDVRAAEHQLAASHYALNHSKASLYPSLTLSGVAGWTNNLGGTVIDPAGLLLNAAGSLFVPIFNSGALRGKVKIDRAEMEVARLAFQQTILNAGAEVNRALTQYQTALDKQEWRALQVTSLTKAVEKTQRLMQHTSTTYLDVLTAQQSLLQAETAQAQDTHDRITAVIALYRALGGGQY